MQNLFTRARAAHQTAEIAAAQARETQSRELIEQENAARKAATEVTLMVADKVLGVYPHSPSVSVIFGHALNVVETTFDFENASWCVQFGDPLTGLTPADLERRIASHKADVSDCTLFFRAPDKWFHVPSIAALGERLSQPDCAHLTPQTSEADDE